MTISSAPSKTWPIAAAPSAATIISRSTSRVRSRSACRPPRPAPSRRRRSRPGTAPSRPARGAGQLRERRRGGTGRALAAAQRTSGSDQNERAAPRRRLLEVGRRRGDGHDDDGTCASAKVFRREGEGLPWRRAPRHRGLRHARAADVRRAADALRMLADPTRLNILWALMQGETSVACLADLAGTTPTAVSQHLSKLRLAGLVTNRREGTFVFYTLADDHIGEARAAGAVARRPPRRCSGALPSLSRSTLDSTGGSGSRGGVAGSRSAGGEHQVALVGEGSTPQGCVIQDLHLRLNTVLLDKSGDLVGGQSSAGVPAALDEYESPVFDEEVGPPGHSGIGVGKGPGQVSRQHDVEEARDRRVGCVPMRTSTATEWR